MRAARFLGSGRIEIVDHAMPKPAPDEVLLEVAYNGLCGSDRKPYKNGFSLIPGHEVTGVVVDGNGTGVPEGTRAAAYLSVTCGQCRYCLRGDTNNCLSRKGLLGWSEPWHGGYAEYMAVPARNILPLDDQVGLDVGVLLLDTIGTAWHCLRLAEAQKTKRALVMGAGPLGQGAIAGLKAFGVREVFASDIAPERLEAAEDLGAKPVSPGDVASLGDLEVIVEAIGRPQTIMEAVRIVEPRGRVVMLGECWDNWQFEPTGETMLKDYYFIRSWYFPVTEFAENQQLLLDGKADPKKLISHVFPLEDLPGAFELFLSGKTRKVLCAAHPK